jgi:endonuclease IV
MSEAMEMVLMIRAVVFAGYDINFIGTKDVRHKFGVRFLRVLCNCMSLGEVCAHHAMILWTIVMAKSERACDMDVCVACLVLSAKMHELNAFPGLKKFATACRRVFESRESTARALEWTLQQQTGMLGHHVNHLTGILKLFECIELTREVMDVSVLNLKHAEIGLLFTTFHGQWYYHLIELYEFLFEKTNHIASGARTDVILCVCGVEHLLTL